VSRTISGPVFATALGDSGPRICFLHGLFGQGKNWTTIAKALADSARLLLVDLPDHGRSAWTETFSYSGMAGAVAELLRHEGSGESYAVVGHSMGGKVAMMLALEHPELVERLCVVDVSPVDYPGLRDFGRYVEGMRELDLDDLPDRATADRELVPYVESATIRSFLLQNLRRNLDGAGHEGNAQVGKPRWQWQMNLKLLGDHLPELGGWPLGSDAARQPIEPYEGPVIWVAGENSDYVRPEFAPAMRSLFPRTQLITIKGASHWVHADRPEVFLATLRRFAGL
jgi:pimeloyl-ACP methyl ester carboxylesterase